MIRCEALASGTRDGTEDDGGGAASAAREIAAAPAVPIVHLVFTHAFSGAQAGTA